MALQVARAVHHDDTTALRREAARWPALARLCSDPTGQPQVRNADELNKLLGKALTSPSTLTAQQRPRPTNGPATGRTARPTPTHGAPARNVMLRPAVRRWHQLWLPHLRRQWIGRILPEPGSTATDANNAGTNASADATTNVRRALQRYWALVFSARQIDESEARRLVDEHIKPIGGEPILPPGNAAVSAALRKARDTAPGPDGLLYSSWRAGGGETATVLRRTLAAAAATGRYPTHFAGSVAVFLPKGASQSDDPHTGMRRRQAGNTRPLALMDTGAKCLMTLLSRPIAERLPAWASPQQQGFIRGRGTLQNVLKLDTSARCLTMRSLELQWDGPGGEMDEDDGAHDDLSQENRRRQRCDDRDEALPPRHRRRLDDDDDDATNRRSDESSRRVLDHRQRCDDRDEALPPRRRRRLDNDDDATNGRSDESSRRVLDPDTGGATLSSHSPDPLAHDSTRATPTTSQPLLMGHDTHTQLHQWP